MAAISAKMLEALKGTMVDADDIDVFFTGLFYGPSGGGKTVLAGSVAQKITPPDKKILWIDTSEGWVSLKNHPGLTDRVQRMKYAGLSQFSMLVDAILQGAEGFGDFGTIVFDEFSTSGRRDMHTIMDADSLGEFDTPEFKHYNAATRRLEKSAFKLMELRTTHNLIFLSHMKQDEDKITKIRVKSPSMMAKFSETLKENMHVVGLVEADVQGQKEDLSYVRTIQVQPSKMVVAKTRIGGLGIKNSHKKFVDRIAEWKSEGGNVVEVNKVPVELEEEKVHANMDDQVAFNGYELGDE